MSALKHLLLSLGSEHLSLTAQEHQQITQFITATSAHFDRVCQQRPERPQLELLLGFMTLYHQQAQSQWGQQQAASTKMKAVFDSTIGEHHRQKFTHHNQDDFTIITHLWLMVQGAMGIDYSYSNEQAQHDSQLLLHCHLSSSEQNHLDQEQLRCQFMQSYYHGKLAYQPHWLERIKKRFIRDFL